MKATTKRQWTDMWDSFDRRQTTKRAPAANEDMGEVRDMFSAAGVAAE